MVEKWTKITLEIPPELEDFLAENVAGDVKPQELLTSFIADLLRISITMADKDTEHNAKLLKLGYQSNGSDERERANDYFDRTFGGRSGLAEEA